MTIQEGLIIRYKYNQGLISREEAKIKIRPFELLFNNKSKEIAKKFGQTPKLFNFNSFMR